MTGAFVAVGGILRFIPSITLIETLSVALVAFAYLFLSKSYGDLKPFTALDALQFDRRPMTVFLRSFEDESLATSTPLLPLPAVPIESAIREVAEEMGPFVRGHRRSSKCLTENRGASVPHRGRLAKFRRKVD